VLEIWLAIINGLFMGLVYCLMASGLTLIWGVMDLVNFAHGECVMVAMFLTFWLNRLLHLDPLISLPVVATASFCLGWILYNVIVRRVVKQGGALSRILVTFGVGIIFANLALFLWGPDYRSASARLAAGIVQAGPLAIGKPKVVAGLIGIMVSGVLYFFLRKTRLGRALQATAMDRDAAALMGVDVERIFSLSWGIGIGLTGIAGCLLTNFMYVHPNVGSVFALLCFAAVALGGLGSVPGAMLGAVLIGEAEALGGLLVGPAFKYMIVYLLYIGVLVWRPRGLMGW